MITKAMAVLIFLALVMQIGKAGTLQWEQSNPSCVLLYNNFAMGVRDAAAEEIWLVYEYHDIVYETRWTKPVVWHQTNPLGCRADNVYYAYTTLGLPFEAESRTASGDWDQIYAFVDVAETLNPIGRIVVDNHPHKAVITKPPEGSVSITARYIASDPDGDLRGIRPQKWNASTNDLESNGGVFEYASGYSFEVVRTYIITEPGDYYFWMDMRDARLQAANTHVSTAAWQSGYRITIKNENRAPMVVLDTAMASGAGIISGNGWAADPDDGTPVSRVEIWLDGVYKMNAALGGDRPDVALHYNRSDYQYSGYSFVLSESNLQSGTHEVTVKAFDKEGISGEHSKSFAYVVPITPPSAPQGLTATALSSYSIRLDWQMVPDERVFYELHRRDTASGYQCITTFGGAATRHTDTELNAVTTYAYRIRAMSADNVASAFSSEAVATTLSVSQNPVNFADWALSYGLDSNRPDDDTDGDGVSNYNEYLMGTNPLLSDSSIHLILSTPNCGHLGVNISNWRIVPVSRR